MHCMWSVALEVVGVMVSVHGESVLRSVNCQIKRGGDVATVTCGRETPSARAMAESSADPVAEGTADSMAVETAEAWIDGLPARWRLGAILGPTASGKSRAIELLRARSLLLPPPASAEAWPSEEAVISAIAGSHAVSEAAAAAVEAAEDAEALELKTAELAMERLGCVGLNSMPTWLRPYAALSNGQRARAHVSRALTSGLALDDFGSTVDARNASVCAAGIARSVRYRGLERVVLASVHEELLPWMGADWAYFPAIGRLVLNPSAGAAPNVRVRYDELSFDAPFARSLPRPSVDGVMQRAKTTTSSSQFSALFGKGLGTRGHKLRSTVDVDAAVRAVSAAFQYTFDGSSDFDEPTLPPLPGGWRLGLLVGPSGSGKSTCLARLRADHQASGNPPPSDYAPLGGEGEPAADGLWPANAPALSALPADAAQILGGPLAPIAAAASRSPFAQLSRGERTLLALARLCGAGTSGSASAAPSLAIADEFTSFVDRPTAAAAAVATRAAWLRNRAAADRLVCASVHADVLPSLKPDWAFDTVTRKLTTYDWDEADLAADAASLQASASADGVTANGVTAAAATSAEALFAPPTVEIDVRQTMAEANELEGDREITDARRKQAENERPAYKRRMWELFEQHHYMSAELSMQSTCAIARWGGTPVGFIAVMPRPGILKASDPRVVHREHRLVVLPEYQGLGIGSRLSEATGARFLARGKRYTSRTAHFVLRSQRGRSPRWRQVLLPGQKVGTATAAAVHIGDFNGTKKVAHKKGGASASGASSAKAGGDGDDADDAAEARMLFTHEYIGNEDEQRSSEATIERLLQAAGTASSPRPASSNSKPRPTISKAKQTKSKKRK